MLPAPLACLILQTSDSQFLDSPCDAEWSEWPYPQNDPIHHMMWVNLGMVRTPRKGPRQPHQITPGKLHRKNRPCREEITTSSGSKVVSLFCGAGLGVSSAMPGRNNQFVNIFCECRCLFVTHHKGLVLVTDIWAWKFVSD